MRCYVGIDLHSTNNYTAVMNEEGKIVLKKRLSNALGVILSFLGSLDEEIVGVAVESTNNWYWFVDALMDAGYLVHLANPAAMVKYSGLKHADDGSDAIWLAELLRLGILPEGYIYPKALRPVRDLLRQRSRLVRQRTASLLSLQNMVLRSTGIKVSGAELKKPLSGSNWPGYLEDGAQLELGLASKELIDFLTEQILALERRVEDLAGRNRTYKLLQTLPGVGRILALTILLETGPIERFGQVGRYASYCRKVSSQWISNERVKGGGNRKNGNRYLAWAFSEAAEHARRNNPESRSFYNRKRNRTHLRSAHNALAHKLARAAYYVMRDQTPFEAAKCFSA